MRTTFRCSQVLSSTFTPNATQAYPFGRARTTPSMFRLVSHTRVALLKPPPQAPPDATTAATHNGARTQLAGQHHIHTHGTNLAGIHLPSTSHTPNIIASVPERYCGVTIAGQGGHVKLHRITEAPLDIAMHGAHVDVGSVKVRAIALQLLGVFHHLAHGSMCFTAMGGQ